MKKIELKKKLSLNKQTVTRLNENKLDRIKGKGGEIGRSKFGNCGTGDTLFICDTGVFCDSMGMNTCGVICNTAD